MAMEELCEPKTVQTTANMLSLNPHQSLMVYIQLPPHSTDLETESRRD
jgi:hypothetical protein